MRPDLLSRRVCDALAPLREDGRPLDPAYAERRIRQALPADLASGTAIEPLGFGSIAGVYRVTTVHGDVACKVLRPGIAERVRADTALLRRGGRRAQRLPGLRNLPVLDMVDFMAGATEMQTNLRREADSLWTLAGALAHLPVRLPALHPSEAPDQVLVMEHLPAFQERDPGRLGEPQARLLLETMFTMIFRSGFVHLDLHHGNYAWSDGGRTLDIVDAGFAVQLSPHCRRQFSEFFIGLAFGNGERCAQSILRSAVGEPPSFDRRAFVDDISAVVHGHRRLPAREFRVWEFTRELFAIQRRHGVFISAEFAAPVFALMTIEQQVREWAPDIDFQLIAQAIIIGSIALVPGNPA